MKIPDMNMKKINIANLAALMLMLSVKVTYAFDINTHAAMTAEALRQSQITASPNSSALFKRLGLFDKDYAIGSYYIDIGSLVKRNTTPYEREVMAKVREADARLNLPTAESIPGWILRGAIREDDNSIETPSGTPQGDEPGGVFDRVFGHFHDPVNNRGLTVRSINVGPVATDWAIKKDTTLSGLGFGSRKNYYNLPAAREAMWRALTLKAWDNGTLSDAPEPTNWTFTNKAELRHAYWATMFRAVGDVVHIVQDMAQPQHTRNDPHGGLGCIPGTSTCLGGHASFIENYLKARTLGSDAFRLDEGFASTTPGKPIAIKTEQLQYGGYTKPMFAKAEDFFVSASGSGLANYSNRGFYSFGTNIASLAVPYPAPPPFGAGLVPVTLSGDDPDPEKRLKDMTGQAIPGAKMTFLTGTVIDSAGGANASDVKLTTTGFWDQFMQQQGGASQYTLNYYNYDDQAKLLIPRAVAYSAGLIDYFFRGQLKIHLPDEGVFAILDHTKAEDNCKDDCGFKKVKLKLANMTPDINVSGGGVVPQGMTGGTVVVVAKFRKNTCYTTDLTGEYNTANDGRSEAQYIAACRSIDESIVVSQPQSNQTIPQCLPSDSPAQCEQKAKPLTFNFDKAIPINATDLYLQVVYRGTLGSEADAVVVETLDIPEPTYFMLVNNTDYIVCYNSTWHFKTPAGGLPAAIPAVIDGVSAEQLYAEIPYSAWFVSFQPNEGDVGTKYVARVDNLQPKQYARFAILIEKDRKYNNTLAGFYQPSPPPYLLTSSAKHQTDYEADGSTRSTVSDYKPSIPTRKLIANVPLFGYLYTGMASQSCIGIPTPPDATGAGYTVPTSTKPVTIVFPD
jgi:hypothetical protein